MCFMWISEEIGIISLHNINWLVFVMDSVFNEEGTTIWNMIYINVNVIFRAAIIDFNLYRDVPFVRCAICSTKSTLSSNLFVCNAGVIRGLKQIQKFACF
jgi:hypothetical protein